jgi:hypothetical protein
LFLPERLLGGSTFIRLFACSGIIYQVIRIDGHKAKNGK